MRTPFSADTTTESLDEVGEAATHATDEPIRMLVRHQWMRDHGTPRVTVLTGPLRSGRALWEEWLALTGRARTRNPVVRQPPRASPTWLEETASRAVERALSAPRDPIGLIVEEGLVDGWLARRDDRLAALVQEGIVRISAPNRTKRGERRSRSQRPAGEAAQDQRARSVAELAMFDALEATPSTRGLFELNGLLSIDFGGRPAEVDLLSRTDEIAIEIDGYHHFTDPEGYRRDRRKDLVLQAQGYAVLRFLAMDVLADTRDAVRTVVELIGQRRRQRRIRR